LENEDELFLANPQDDECAALDYQSCFQP